MYLRLGFVDNIIVSSPKTAELFLKTHDLVFASGPPHEASKYILYGQKNLSFSQYGPYWRDVRKLCTLQLPSNLKINSFRDMRREELCLLIESIKKAAGARVPVDLSAKVSSLSADMSCTMMFGKKYEDEEIDERGFKDVFREGMKVSATPNLGDYFPYLGKLDLQRLTKRMKALGKVFDQFLERIIDEHEQGKNRGQSEDFVDTLLLIMKSGEIDFQFNREHVKSIMLDLLGASMDTSPAVIEWTMSELLRQPQIMKKVQQELENNIGLDRMVEYDLESLKYLELVVKESLRLHPVVPLLLPHEAREDCMVDGFHIPKKARILVNV